MTTVRLSLKTKKRLDELKTKIEEECSSVYGPLTMTHNDLISGLVEDALRSLHYKDNIKGE